MTKTYGIKDALEDESVKTTYMCHCFTPFLYICKGCLYVSFLVGIKMISNHLGCVSMYANYLSDGLCPYGL